jgi:hypothetical protein
LRYVKINATNNQVILDITYGHATRYYFFPSIFVDGQNNISLVFNTNFNPNPSPGKKYPSVFYTTRMDNENQTRNSRILRGGLNIIKIGEREKRYGDYTGICLDPLNDNQFWFCGEYVISNYNWGTYIGSIITNQSTVQVTLTNLIAEENASGELKLKRNDGNYSLLPSGYTLKLMQSTSYQSRTENERLPLNVFSHKHHDWNDNYGEYRMEHSLPVGTSPINDDAMFLPLNPGNVFTFLMSANQSNLIDIDFKDPWFVEEDGSQPDTFETYDTPFTPGTGQYIDYGGVFLNQDPEFEPDIPNYSLRILPQHVIPFHEQNITWYFQDWQGEEDEVDFQYPNQTETDVVFKQAGAVANAVYKGHMVSSIEEATGANNGRRVVRDNVGCIHLVYEDQGQIYYTLSADEGLTWLPETKLSTDPATNKYPTICRRYSDGAISVVWTKIEAGTHYLWYKQRNYGIWNAQGSWNLGNLSSQSQPTALFRKDGPGQYEELFIICHGIYNSQEKLYIYQAGNPFVHATIPNTNSYSISPSVTTPVTVAGNNNYTIYFVWTQSNDMQGHIYYSTFNTQNSTFGTTQNVSITPYCYDAYSCQYRMNREPSISIDGSDKIHVVWAAYSNPLSKNVILHRQKSFSGSWYNYSNYFTEIYTGTLNAGDPVIGSATAYQTPDYFDISYVRYVTGIPGLIYIMQSRNGIWDPFPQAFSGVMPSLNGVGWNDHTGWGGFSILQMAWSDAQESAPHFIKQVELSDERGEDESFDQLNISRQEIFDFEQLSGLNLKGEICQSLGSMQVQRTNLTQPWMFITSNQLSNPSHFLKTSDLDITPDVQSAKIKFEIQVKNFSKTALVPRIPLLSLNLKESSTGKILACLREIPITVINDSTFSLSDSLNIDLKVFNGLRVTLEMQTIFHFFASTNNQALLIETLEETPQSSIAKEMIKYSKVNVLPRSSDLAQNYPNPFNPVTTIAFDLPKDIQVLLEIFDITGQKICTLVNEPKEAGTHQVIWNGQDDHGNSVASGVYVYRIQAGDFVQSKKLLFMK